MVLEERYKSTNNFIMHFISQDINAFKYVVQFANMNIIKKIKSPEISRNFLRSLRFAIDHLKVKGGLPLFTWTR